MVSSEQAKAVGFVPFFVATPFGRLPLMPIFSVLLVLMVGISMRGVVNGTKVGSRKTILLVRHGVTEMNEHLANHKWGSEGFVDICLWDTVLSTSGTTHAQNVNKFVKTICPVDLADIELVVASPLTRAIQTTETVFAGTHIMSDSMPRLVNPLIAERCYMTSDVGRKREVLEKEFSGKYTYTPYTHIHTI